MNYFVICPRTGKEAPIGASKLQKFVRAGYAIIKRGDHGEAADTAAASNPPGPVEDVVIEEIVEHARIVNSLKAHGIKTARGLLDADDETLIDVWGINEDNLEKYRDRSRGLLGDD